MNKNLNSITFSLLFPPTFLSLPPLLPNQIPLSLALCWFSPIGTAQADGQGSKGNHLWSILDWNPEDSGMMMATRPNFYFPECGTAHPVLGNQFPTVHLCAWGLSCLRNSWEPQHCCFVQGTSSGSSMLSSAQVCPPSMLSLGFCQLEQQVCLVSPHSKHAVEDQEPVSNYNFLFRNQDPHCTVDS